MFYIGVDPGLKGAVALLKTSSSIHADNSVHVFDVPRADREGRVDGYMLAETLDYYGVNRRDRVVIEEVQSMPGEGHVGAFTFGHGAGVIEGRFLPGVKEEHIGNGSPAHMNRIMEAAKALERRSFVDSFEESTMRRLTTKLDLVA